MFTLLFPSTARLKYLILYHICSLSYSSHSSFSDSDEWMGVVATAQLIESRFLI